MCASSLFVLMAVASLQDALQHDVAAITTLRLTACSFGTFFIKRKVEEYNSSRLLQEIFCNFAPSKQPMQHEKDFALCRIPHVIMRMGATEVHRTAVARREQGPFAAIRRLAAEVRLFREIRPLWLVGGGDSLRQERKEPVSRPLRHHQRLRAGDSPVRIQRHPLPGAFRPDDGDKGRKGGLHEPAAGMGDSAEIQWRVLGRYG